MEYAIIVGGVPMTSAKSRAEAVFEATVVQDLAGWQSKAPRLPEPTEAVDALDEPPVVEPSAEPAQSEIATPELASVDGYSPQPMSHAPAGNVGPSST